MPRGIDDVEDVAWDDWSQPRSRRRVVVVVAAAALALLVCGGGLALRAYATGQAQKPLVAARAYCAALTSQRYAAAYALLAVSARAGETAAQWTADATLHDTIDGRVTRCLAAAPSRGALGDFSDSLGITFGTLGSVPITLTLTRAHLSQRSAALTLARQPSQPSGQSGSWQISAIPAPLQGTPLDPLKTVQGFCQALAAGNYQQAYTYLSAHQVALVKSATAFAQQVAPPTGTKYAGCAPDYVTYQVHPTAARIALALNISVTTTSGTSTVPVHGTALLVLERGAWKLDGLNLGTPSS